MSHLRLESLREKLLAAGIAPRHVRRYESELRQHFDDLLRAETANGLSGEAAMASARARLGSDESLAGAMLARPELRSLAARRPWLMFGILPLLAALLGFALVVMVTQEVAINGGAYIPRQGFVSPAPLWMVQTLQGAMFVLNFLFVPLLGMLLAWAAQRQRMVLLWPLLGLALLLVLHVHGLFEVNALGQIRRGFSTLLPLPGLFGSVGFNGPIFLAQALLLCLPAAWLWRARRKFAAAP